MKICGKLCESVGTGVKVWKYEKLWGTVKINRNLCESVQICVKLRKSEKLEFCAKLENFQKLRKCVKNCEKPWKSVANCWWKGGTGGIYVNLRTFVGNSGTVWETENLWESVRAARGWAAEKKLCGWVYISTINLTFNCMHLWPLDVGVVGQFPSYLCDYGFRIMKNVLRKSEAERRSANMWRHQNVSCSRDCRLSH